MGCNASSPRRPYFTPEEVEDMWPPIALIELGSFLAIYAARAPIWRPADGRPGTGRLARISFNWIFFLFSYGFFLIVLSFWAPRHIRGWVAKAIMWASLVPFAFVFVLTLGS